jgi:DNA gyrase subunit A
LKKAKLVLWEEMLLEFEEFHLKDANDEVVGMVTVNDMDANVLVVSENGYGKRSSLEDYRVTNRGGKGVKTISITEKTGKLVP